MSQFPIPGQSAGDISPLDAIKDNWPTFKDSIGIALGFPALVVIVPFLVTMIPGILIAIPLGIFSIKNEAAIFLAIPLGILACLWFALAYNLLRVGWVRTTLQLARGEECSINDLRAAWPWFKNFFIVNLLIGLMTAIGSVLFIIPGILIAVRCAFAPLLIVDENLSPLEALKRSNQLVKGQSWQIFQYFLAYFGANTVGGLVPIIGMVAPIATMGYFDMVLARIYYLRK